MKINPKLELKYQKRKKDNVITTTITNQINKKDNRVKYNKKAESEFFVDNSALAGFTGERILYMAVRELIENSLDACEIHHILPNIIISMNNIDVENDLWTISCEDNGVGINSEKVPVAVCSFLTSGKYVEKQQRGLFGVGLKMIAAFSTKDTDKPIRVWSKSIDEEFEYYYELRTDINTNKPIVLNKKLLSKTEKQIKDKHGFKIIATLRARLSPITKNKIYDYISQTSIVNPYANLIFENDDGKITFARRTEIMPHPAQEVLPHPAEMDLQTLKKAILNFSTQKISIQSVLSCSFQKLSIEKAREIISISQSENKLANLFSESDLIKIVNACKQMKFQAPNTDHLSPIGEQILTTGMMSEYIIVNNKDQNKTVNHNENGHNLNVRILKPVFTSYSSRSTVISNRPTIIECGIAYGGNINSFKLYRFANKIPLLYDEGSDVAREVVSEVGINKMGITKKEAKEQFANDQKNKTDRAVELLPLHIFFHICSTKIPYKSAGKESIASEGEMKRYMKLCLSDLYRKVSAQIRRDLRVKDAENRLKLYKYYIPLIVDAISDSIKIDRNELTEKFIKIAEKHVKKEIITHSKDINKNKEDHLTRKKLTSIQESSRNIERKNKDLNNKSNPKSIIKEKIVSRKTIKKITLDDFHRS
ncbi:MAG TPA: DNA topoisomerase VI subunit B [Nitrososphaeraceae archaeon]|nr:DNA topoisomerase VI subunit B [Nitrososphaeraceae archaeon]